MKFQGSTIPSDHSILSSSSIDRFQDFLKLADQKEYFQIWFEKDDGETACVLANSQWAYISVLPVDELYLITDGSDEHSGSTKIFLENGQLNEFEISECVERATGISAGLHYFQTGMPAPFIAWTSE